MMENEREGLVAVVVRLLAGLLRRPGGSEKAPARRAASAALAVNAGTDPTNDEGGCPDPAHCPEPVITGVAAAS